MRSLRVAILTHEDLVPPESLTGLSEQEIQPWKREYDVAAALEARGHEVRVLGVSDEPAPIRHLVEAWKPHVVFNLLLEFRDEAAYQAHIASYLELLRVPYTGCGPRGLLLARDKALSKQILRYHRIPTPGFAVYRLGRKVRARPPMPFPLIVKSIDEDASRGVSQASVVHGLEQLAERVEFVHRRIGTGAIAEEYIVGRELTIGVLGNERLQTFPVWEMFFRRLPEGDEPIATERVKWDLEYQKRIGLQTGPAAPLPDGAEERMQKLAKRVFRALDLSGFARVDFRLAEDERIFVIEANATPDISLDEDLASSAASVGVDYEELIERIVRLGLRNTAPGRGARA